MDRVHRPLVRDDLERMNLPPEFWHARVQGIPDSVREAATRYLTKLPDMIMRPVGLVLCGPPGVGKTGMAAVVAKETRSIGFTVYFVPVWELREDVRNRVEFESGRSILDRCREVDLLVLDGLRLEDATMPIIGAREIEDLIAARTSRLRPTIVTTRAGLRDLRGKGFEGFVEVSQSALVSLEVKGPNLRNEQQAQLVAELGLQAAAESERKK